MADDLKIRRPEDPKKINVNEYWEVITWTKKFNVSEAELKAAVKAVGVNVADVENYLASKKV